jgi:hypothetical protein
LDDAISLRAEWVKRSRSQLLSLRSKGTRGQRRHVLGSRRVESGRGRRERFRYDGLGEIVSGPGSLYVEQKEAGSKGEIDDELCTPTSTSLAERTTYLRPEGGASKRKVDRSAYRTVINKHRNPEKKRTIVLMNQACFSTICQRLPSLTPLSPRVEALALISSWDLMIPGATSITLTSNG